MADRYWVNDAADGLWNNANNWSASDGGGGGAGVPANGDAVWFTGSCTDNCTLDVNTALLLSLKIDTPYTGTVDFNDYNVTTTDYQTHGVGVGGSILCGNGTITCGGNWSSRYASARINYEGSTVIWSGSSKTHDCGDAGPFNNLTVSGSYSGTWGVVITGACTISGTLTCNTKGLYHRGTALTVNGTLNGNATDSYAGKADGTIAVSGTGTIATAIRFGHIYNYLCTVEFGANTPTVTGTASFGNKDYAKTTTIANSTNNPSLVFQGSISVDPEGNGVTWTKGTGIITLSGANDQTIDFDGKAVEDIVINKSAGNVVMTGGVTTDSFTGTSTGSGDFDPNGQTITTTGNCDWAAAFVFDSAADCLNGCTWDIAGNFTANGQTLNATAEWYLQVHGTAVASGSGEVEYSNADGTHTEIDASGWTDGGNNTNWTFGGVTVTPPEATSQAATIAPTVVLGSLSITPVQAISQTAIVAPVVVLGSLTLTPAQATSQAATVDPTTILGSVTVTPSEGTAQAAVIDPSVVLSSMTLTPAASAAQAIAVSPIVILGSLSITPSEATAQAAAVDPTVQVGGVLVIPAEATSQAAIVAPTVVLGSLSITPAEASAIAVALSPTVLLIAPSIGVGPDALRVYANETLVSYFHEIGTIPGVVVLHAAGRNGEGYGRLRYRASDGVAWRAPGSWQYGAPVGIGEDRTDLLLGDGSDPNKFIRVDVHQAYLRDASQHNVYLTDRYNNGPPDDDVTAVEATAGNVHTWTLSLSNDSTTTIGNIVVWLDTDTEDLEISDNGVDWVAPTTEGAGLALGSLAPAASATLHLRRTIAAASEENPRRLVEFHYAWDGI